MEITSPHPLFSKPCLCTAIRHPPVSIITGEASIIFTHVTLFMPLAARLTGALRHVVSVLTLKTLGSISRTTDAAGVSFLTSLAAVVDVVGAGFTLGAHDGGRTVYFDCIAAAWKRFKSCFIEFH